MKPPKREVSMVDLTFHDRWKAEANADKRFEDDLRKYADHQEREERKRRAEEARRARAQREAAHAEKIRKAGERDRQRAAAAAPAAQSAPGSGDSPFDAETGVNIARFVIACFVLWVFTTTFGRFLLIPFALYLFLTREGRARILRALGAGFVCGAIGGLWWGVLEIAPWDSGMTTSDGLILMGTFAGLGLGAALTWPKSAFEPEPLSGMASDALQQAGADDMTSPEEPAASGADGTMGLDLTLGTRT